MVLKNNFLKSNNKGIEDSKPLKIYKKIIKKFLSPLNKFVLRFINFLMVYKGYILCWVIIWGLNFNLITIIIEFLAYYLYFVTDFDVLSIFVQLYKFSCDISVIFAFIPAFMWVILSYILLWVFRFNYAFNALNHFENCNCGFINERPIISMVVGTVGKKKTTLLTDMSLSIEKMFRDKSFEMLYENDMCFQKFPWQRLEDFVKICIEKHIIYNLATCKQTVRLLRQIFEMSLKCDDVTIKSMKRYCEKVFGSSYKLFCYNYNIVYLKSSPVKDKYMYGVFCFGYDLHNGLYFNDRLEVKYLWDIIENYVKLYFVYIIQSSLIISNYSIRTDGILNDKGNFPLWNSNFFKRDPYKVNLYSRYSHIIDYDMFRLGKVVVENNVKKDCFDFGIVDMTELAKDRRNQLELREVKRNTDETNQKNDGFNDFIKLIRHASIVDNYPFARFLGDDQRPESLGADLRELMDILHISECSERKLTVPFFFIWELFFDIFSPKFKNLYYEYRFYRRDNTLFMYLIKKYSGLLYNFYRCIYNQFGYYRLKIDVETGKLDGIYASKKYYLSTKKIYSKRFSTDCFSDYFYKKKLRSKLGINDLEEYSSVKATMEELDSQHSYFIEQLNNIKK